MFYLCVLFYYSFIFSHSFTYKDGTSEEFVTDFVVKMVNLVFDTFILRGVARILHRGWIVKLQLTWSWFS